MGGPAMDVADHLNYIFCGQHRPHCPREDLATAATFYDEPVNRVGSPVKDVCRWLLCGSVWRYYFW